MIFGRPTNLWLGLVTALLGVVQVTVPTLFPSVDGTQLTVVLGAVGVFLGALITLVANQPPTLNPGDPFRVATPSGQPNEVRNA